MDVGVEVPEGWEPAEEDRTDIQRLLASSLLSLAATGVPKRLGGEAERDELARDKKVSRMVANAYLVCLRPHGLLEGGWLELVRQATSDKKARREGATVEWEFWLEERIAYLHQRAARLAAYAVKTGNLSWGNRAVFRIDRERELLQRAKEQT